MDRGNEKHLPQAGMQNQTCRLIPYVLGVLVLIATSVFAIADQSSKLVSVQEIVGVHGIPSFVFDRIEGHAY
jgi:hypothetical protein